MADGGQHSLRPGTRLGDYEVVAELGSGSFGTTYKAFDQRLQTAVAIKEYLPTELARREPGSSQVAPRSDSLAPQYQFGLKAFLEEARALAQFRDARIVRITNYMEANGSAYLVMDYEEGESLDAFLRREQRRLEERELLRVMIPILEGLCIVHRAGVLHRDVKPANIHLRAQGSPLLLGFGAARHALSQETDDPTSITSPGYAASEQYRHDGNEGPWTDVYGAGATMYRLATGRPPASAPDRAAAVQAGQGDPNPPALKDARGRYSERLLEAIDWMLQPLPRDRPQRVEDALERIAATGSPPTSRDVGASAISSGARARKAAAVMSQERAARRHWMLGLATGLGVALAVAGLGMLAARRTSDRAPAAAGPPADAAIAPGMTAAVAAAEAVREREIIDLLAKALAAEAELRLTTPEGDSAMFYYQQVLSLDPERAVAREGVRRIVVRYVALTDSAAASGNRAQAATYLERAASIAPNDPEVIGARARLADAPPRTERGAERPRPSDYASFRQVKEALRARRIDDREYDQLVDALKRRREAELLRAKAAYVDHEISRDAYARRVREIKLRYDGR